MTLRGGCQTGSLVSWRWRRSAWRGRRRSGAWFGGGSRLPWRWSRACLRMVSARAPFRACHSLGQLNQFAAGQRPELGARAILLIHFTCSRLSGRTPTNSPPGLSPLGPFQPSNDMMLKFYSYYKQATLGPCNIPRPGFWDAVGKAKWSVTPPPTNMISLGAHCNLWPTVHADSCCLVYKVGAGAETTHMAQFGMYLTCFYFAGTLGILWETWWKKRPCRLT